MKKVILNLFLLLILIFGVYYGYKGVKEINFKKSDVLLTTVQNEKNDKEDIEKVEHIKEEKDIIEDVSENDMEKYKEIPLEEVRIPILMYHSISDTDPNNSLLVPPALFEEHIKWLSDNGFTAMSLDEVKTAKDTGKVPEKPVVITFDDGYVDNYTAAFPILQKYNMKATFFIITNNTDKDGYYMSSNMLKEMNEKGMEIENHTAYHLELNTLSREEQVASIKDGQAFLKDVIGVESNDLCYPVGRYNDITLQVAKELNINLAVTTEGGISDFEDGPYDLKRVRISPMNIESFSSIFEEFVE